MRPKPGDRVAILRDRGGDGYDEVFGTLRGVNRDKRFPWRFRYFIEGDYRSGLILGYRRWNFRVVK